MVLTWSVKEAALWAHLGRTYTNLKLPFRANVVLNGLLAVPLTAMADPAGHNLLSLLLYSAWQIIYIEEAKFPIPSS